MTDDKAAREISAAIREHADYHFAPASLASDVMSSLPVAEEAPRRPRWQRWLAQAAAMAGVAVVTWAATMGYLRPNENEHIGQEMLSSHVRATLGNRLYDVASSDQHTVKPWLSAHLAFSPPVTDFSAHGFELRGARLDHLDGQPVAVLVYGRRQHVIDVFVRPARGAAAQDALTLDGFNVLGFVRSGMDFRLISDLNRNELGDLVRLLAQNSAAP
jgi:anti-sigma factor RsiW